MIFDPPNLAKSPLRSDSIKILTKGLLHYSRKGVRMPKFRNFYRTSPEISTFFSLFSYSVSWQGRRGPFPWLEDCECKRARPPSDQVFSRSASVWSAKSGAVGSCFPLCLYQNYRAAPFGHCHNLISSSNHLELKSIRLWNHIVQQSVTTLLNELAMRVFLGTPHTCPNSKKLWI